LKLFALPKMFVPDGKRYAMPLWIYSICGFFEAVGFFATADVAVLGAVAFFGPDVATVRGVVAFLGASAFLGISGFDSDSEVVFFAVTLLVAEVLVAETLVTVAFSIKGESDIMRYLLLSFPGNFSQPCWYDTF